MNKKFIRGLLGLIVVAFAIIYEFLSQGTNVVDALPQKQLTDWYGSWNCNLDGRNAVLELNMVYDPKCEDALCRTVPIGVKGRISDNGGSWVAMEQRPFSSSDPLSADKVHILPLLYNKKDPWLLIMHTGNRQFASGYTTWNGTMFGLQCRKSS